MMHVFTDALRTARKPHCCIWCGQRIETGEAYRYVTLVSDDGDFQSQHYHCECNDAAAEDVPMDDCFLAYSNTRPARKEQAA